MTIDPTARIAPSVELAPDVEVGPWVIIDGPPVTTYPDSSNLAVVADGAILVVRAEKTRWEVAQKAIKVLNEAGAAVLGGVLNGRKYHIPEFIYKRL